MNARDFRIVPTAALTATFVAALAFVLMFPRAALWIGVLALVLAVCGLFTLAAETVQLRQDLADAERKHEVLTDALMAADQENAILSGRLDDVASVPLVPFDSLSREEREHIAADRPDLRIVDPVADEPVPIHDRLLIDHWIEDVQTWGEDVES